MFEEKKYDKAIELYSRILPDDANSILAYCNLAKIYAILKDDKKSLRCIEKALGNKGNPAHAFVYYNAASYYEDKEDYGKSFKYYLKALELFPQDAAVYAKIGGIYEKLGYAEKAVQIYSDAINRVSDKTLFLSSLLKLIFDMGKYDEAEVLAFKILELNPPGDCFTYETLGALRARKGDYKNALIYFTSALLIKNDFASAYFYRAIVHFHNKMYDKAKEDVLNAQKYGFEVPKDFKDELYLL
jgi:tetratricopeptide (TPR) repeat protein